LDDIAAPLPDLFTSSQIKLTHRRLHQSLTFGLELAKLPLRTRDSFLIFGENGWSTDAGFDSVSCVPTWVGIHGSDPD